MKDLFKNRCDIVKDLLPLYADNGCSPKTNDCIKLHLVTCRSCRDYLAGIKKYRQNTDSENEVPDSHPDFADVINKIRRRRIISRAVFSAIIITSLAVNAVILLTHDQSV